ncbi:MAG TPA: glycine zipper 2TM domain-containing protein [Thermomonas sp.]|nr:glycine zipper 2TM domain-containing protein [Thermomonas sp.]
MKNNTLAIALGALLVGGVATAGFMNNNDRGSGQPTAVDDVGLAVDGPAQRGLAYADVVDVQPVIERAERYATVIGTDPVRESSSTTTPQQVCEDVAVQERLPERDGNVGGTVAGTLIGGLVGNQIGGGNGKKAATAAGAVAGGFIGNRVDRNHVGGQVVNRVDRRCRTVNNTSTSSRTVAWNVTYRNPDGTTGSLQTDHKPGDRISLGADDRTVAYDVRYMLDGDIRTVRMTQPPGERLPLVDGQVVTQVASVAGTPNS